MTVRQLTSGEQYLLDLLADAEYTRIYGGDLLTHSDMWVGFHKIMLHMSMSPLTAELVIQDKVKLLRAKRAEEYNDKVEHTVALPRAPFGDTWEGVPFDAITRQYIAESGQAMPEFWPDLLGPGSDDMADRERRSIRIRARNTPPDPAEVRRAKYQDKVNREQHLAMSKVDPVSTKTKGIPWWMHEDLTARDRNIREHNDE